MQTNRHTQPLVQLIGFFEPVREEIHKTERPLWDQWLTLPPDEIVSRMLSDDDRQHPFYHGGDDGGETDCEWLTEDDYLIGEGLLDNGGRRAFSSDGRYLVCYEPADERIEIYNHNFQS